MERGLLRARPDTAELWHRQWQSTQAWKRADAVSIGYYPRLVHRHRRILVFAAVLGFLAGLVGAAYQTPTWISNATVLASPVAIDPTLPLDKTLRPKQTMTIDTEAAELISSRVLARAVAGTGLSTDALLKETTVTAVTNSRVLRIQVRDQNPAQARQLVTNLSQAYLYVRGQVLAQRLAEQIKALQVEINALMEHKGLVEQSSTLLNQADANHPAIAPDDPTLSNDDPLSADDANGTGATTSTSTSATGTTTSTTTTSSSSTPTGTTDTTTEDLQTTLRALRSKLSSTQATSIDAGQLLRSASVPRKLNVQPEVPIISWTLVGLVIGGLLAGIREWRPAAPRTTDEVNRRPMARDLPVAVLDRTGPVDDGRGGWMAVDNAGWRPRSADEIARVFATAA